MDISDKLCRVGEFFLGAVRETVTQHEESAVSDEYINGLYRMTAALYEAKVDEDEIIRLIQKYYEITNSEAEEVIRIEKQILRPCRLLEEYLKREKGFTKERAVKYIISHNTEVELQNNLELSKLDSKKLYLYLERNS